MLNTDAAPQLLFAKFSVSRFSRVSLHPGSSFNLPIVFHPSEDNPPPGKLLVGTNSESWEIELIGMGREAVLIISKVALEYTDCLIGNSYEQRLGLKNVGDVNYPVSFKFETPFSDIEFHPESLIVQPFSESFVKINYTPTQSVKTNLLLIISSPYSTHKIPIILHSGTASLDFSHDLIDFGMFERISSPIFSFKLKNTGTVATSYYLKDTVKPSRFSFTNNKGLAGPGKSIEVIITHTRHEVGSFLETLIVKTDLLNKVYHIKVKGHCEEALVHPDELNFVNMGICPVLETTTKPLSITNYGKFPLNFTIKAAYPLKVFPIVGSVEGSETQDVNILWGPSGSYELRTQLSIATNIGNFTTIVRGKSMFPDLGLKSLTLDFGVCAAGHIYSENIVLFNKGKVPLHFTIPPPRDSSFSISKQSGDLAPKEEVSVGLDFCPATFGRLATSVIVECKGINYKEVLVSGIGAVMKMDISPKILELGPCPCDLPSQHLVSFKNSGDVLLKLSFSYSSKDKPKSCTLIFPEPVEIKPGDIAKCTYSVIPHVVGKFFAKMAVVTKEKTYHLPVSGKSRCF